MKRVILVLLIFLVIGGSLAFASNTTDDTDTSDIPFIPGIFAYDSNWTGNFFLSFFSFPGLNPGETILSAILTSCLSIGLGYHLNIIPDILSPGIYGDVHLSWLMLLFNNDEDDYNEDGFSFVQLGIRVYNNMRFGMINIQPFAGLTAMFIGNHTIGVITLGFVLAFGNYGFEYSYIQHTNIHRVSFGIHF